MKPEHNFIAERALAQHCAELLRPVPAASELSPLLAMAAERLGRSLRAALAPLLSGELPLVECVPQSEMSVEDFAARGGLNAWSVYSAGVAQERLLSSIDAEAVLRLVDRAFGGPGDAPSPLPRELPLSAELMVQRLESVMAVRLGEALGGRPVIRPLRRDSNLKQVQPFLPGTRLAVLAIDVTEGSRGPWTIRFAIPLTALAAMTGAVDAPAEPRKNAPSADPMSEPFADLPLSVTALLVDMAMPLSTISALEVGQVLNLPIARNVPLRIGKRTLGHGSIGAVDDRVAVQLNQLS
jgi:flagellar motor switch protein FliM